ncbi:hypothetical protein [Arsenicicoccus dermatophilus]|uniref:hypothetical protein n=1 Tax=Arsenicicoccus dermatophilus TaxID=1076331 RepID=UPI003916F75D
MSVGPADPDPASVCAAAATLARLHRELPAPTGSEAARVLRTLVPLAEALARHGTVLSDTWEGAAAARSGRDASPESLLADARLRADEQALLDVVRRVRSELGPTTP